ncbi:hypothetical protein C8R42DRAFT_726767 [Lentinula raphanica]|nr:hypothetical protein C8R42DRAFT_726767 [Lentinula raphanica]
MSNSPESSGSNSTDPLFAYALCVYQTEGQNPDMQGYAVRLSNFIVNVCLGLLIRFSEENVADSVTVLLLQVYTLLICTFISLIRKQLSVADAHFALTSTVSPLALYLLYAALRTLLRRSSYLFRRLGDDNRTYLALSILMLPMWIVLNMLIYFADVFSGPSCPHITFENWFAFETEATIVSFVFASVFMGLIVLVWIVYFLRHFKDIRGEYRRHKMKAPHWKWFGWIRWFPLSFKSLMLAQWDVITKSHPWVLTLLIWTAYVIWGSSLLLYVTDIYELYYDFIITIQSADGTDFSPYNPPTGYDPLGYGQLLAAAVAFPPLWQVMWMTWGSRGKLLAWIKGYPASLWNGTVFLITGRRNPWKKVLENRDSGSHGSHSTSESSYDSLPLTGPNEKVQSLESAFASFPTQEKINSLIGLKPAWNSTTANYSTVHSTTSTLLYDPYNPAAGKRDGEGELES